MPDEIQNIPKRKRGCRDGKGEGVKSVREGQGRGPSKYSYDPSRAKYSPTHHVPLTLKVDQQMNAYLSQPFVVSTRFHQILGSSGGPVYPPHLLGNLHQPSHIFFTSTLRLATAPAQYQPSYKVVPPSFQLPLHVGGCGESQRNPSHPLVRRRFDAWRSGEDAFFLRLWDPLPTSNHKQELWNCLMHSVRFSLHCFLIDHVFLEIGVCLEPSATLL